MPRKTAKTKTPDRDSSFLQALTEYYPDDRLAPGIVIAWLSDRHAYYASVARYPAGAKEVVVTAYGESIESVIDSLASAWAARIGRGPAVAAFVESRRGACAG